MRAVLSYKLLCGYDWGGGIRSSWDTHTQTHTHTHTLFHTTTVLRPTKVEHFTSKDTTQEPAFDMHVLLY